MENYTVKSCRRCEWLDLDW